MENEELIQSWAHFLVKTTPIQRMKTAKVDFCKLYDDYVSQYSFRPEA